eukprot:4666331-Prymnesium_polylepis.2
MCEVCRVRAPPGVDTLVIAFASRGLRLGEQPRARSPGTLISWLAVDVVAWGIDPSCYCVLASHIGRCCVEFLHVLPPPGPR